MGNAPITTATIAATKRAKRCQASGTRPSGHRGEPEPEGQGQDGGPGDEGLPVGGGRRHGVAPLRRTRPSRPHGPALDRAVLGRERRTAR